MNDPSIYEMLHSTCFFFLFFFFNFDYRLLIFLNWVGDKWIVSTGGPDRCVFLWKFDAEADLTEETKDIQDSGLISDGSEQLASLIGWNRRIITAGWEEGQDDDDDINDRFVAIKPWLSTVVAPNNPSRVRKKFLVLN